MTLVSLFSGSLTCVGRPHSAAAPLKKSTSSRI